VFFLKKGSVASFIAIRGKTSTDEQKAKLGAMEAIESAKMTTKLVPPAPRRMLHYNML
jgi:hypothetical protein